MKLFWWIVVEVFFIAFFVYGYVIYRKRVRSHQEREDNRKDREANR